MSADGWIFPHPGEDIDHFLSRARPSITSNLVASWISVDSKEARARPRQKGNCIPNCVVCESGDFEKNIGDIRDDHVTISPESGGEEISLSCLSALQKAVEDYRHNVLETSKTVAKAKKLRFIHTLYHLSAADGLTCGKWMLFVSTEHVDGVWRDIARGTVGGKLGVAAKVATRSPSQDSHLICVYCSDFTDVLDCQRVLKELFRMGMHVRAAFKPDFFTYLDINSAEAAELKIKDDWLLHRDILKAVQNGESAYPDPEVNKGEGSSEPSLKLKPAKQGQLRFDQFGFGKKVLEKRRQGASQ